MAEYHATGESTATAATIDLAVAQIWNPSTSKRIWVTELHVWKRTAGAADTPTIRRSTARGATPSSTVTPTSVHEREQIAAPPSGWLLDLGTFGTQPTYAAGNLKGAIIPGAIGAGLMWVLAKPMEIPAGNGLCIVTGIALAFPVSRVSVVIED